MKGYIEIKQGKPHISKYGNYWYCYETIAIGHGKTINEAYKNWGYKYRFRKNSRFGL